MVQRLRDPRRSRAWVVVLVSASAACATTTTTAPDPRGDRADRAGAVDGRDGDARARPTADGAHAAEPTAAVTPAGEAPAGEAPAEGAPVPPPVRAVLLLGDSKIATDFGAALQRTLAATPTADAAGAAVPLRVGRRGKSATGLARPDFFDWMAEAERVLAQHRPDLVVVGLGGNDGQDLVGRPGDQGPRRVAWGSDAWPEHYAARLTRLLDLLAGDDRRVVWLEVTTADRPRLEAKLRLIREVQREAVARFGARAVYLETRHHFFDASGALVREVEVDRRRQPLRMEDGIHFSVPGSRWLAPRVAAELLGRVGMGAPP